MKLLRKSVIAGAVIGGTTALVGLAAVPAYAASGFSGADPYAVPQSSPGVPNDDAVNITLTGLTPGTAWEIAVCDGVPITTSGWSTNSDCGPFTSQQSALSNGTTTFSGTGSNGLFVWHGDGTNQTYEGTPGALGGQPFNCLAPDDNANSATTTDGAQTVNTSEPAWGATSGGNAANTQTWPAVPATNPCQIVAIPASSAGQGYSTSMFAEPINLTAQSGASTPESPVAIALPAGGIAILGAATAFGIRRRRQTSAA